MVRMYVRGTVEERYLAYVLKSSIPGACWDWTAHKHKSGYGVLMHTDQNGRWSPIGAHVISFRLHIGRVPSGMEVCHSCDTPHCTNPGHLFLGTHADNMEDMSSKKRSAWGERSGHAVLTESDVAAIRQMRRDGVRRHIVADLFGLNPTYVSAITKHKRWRLLDEPT
jgi:hypothetical protein